MESGLPESTICGNFKFTPEQEVSALTVWSSALSLNVFGSVCIYNDKSSGAPVIMRIIHKDGTAIYLFTLEIQVSFSLNYRF
ncbi:S-Ena type endospore appendage [Paenibacillus sp. S150]|uniref:S-Ena type endospore appendage n=1 Tax=Paenibacillus sp. S150 TaxID=2749826 RepID=UPI0035C9E7EC